MAPEKTESENGRCSALAWNQCTAWVFGLALAIIRDDRSTPCHRLLSWIERWCNCPCRSEVQVSKGRACAPIRCEVVSETFAM